jgi:hypothetical protein
VIIRVLVIAPVYTQLAGTRAERGYSASIFKKDTADIKCETPAKVMRPNRCQESVLDIIFKCWCFLIQEQQEMSLKKTRRVNTESKRTPLSPKQQQQQQNNQNNVIKTF